MKKIVLASASPRRREILKNLNLDFEVIPSQVNENIEGEKFSNALIENLALEKVLDVQNKIDFPAIVIGSDTVVVVDEEILGKPRNDEDAFRMLKMLSGRNHLVISAIAIAENSKKLVDSVISEVKFRELSDAEILAYIKTGEPQDKAGAYAIQGLAGIFVESISGCYLNIVGISAFTLAQMLKCFDITIL